MRPRTLLGGALAGIAGLAAATFIDHKIREAKFSSVLQKPESLDAKQITIELNNYFFKQQAVLSECNRIMLEASDTIVNVMPLPWDSAVQKAANAVGGKLLKICRKGNMGRILMCKEQAEEIYGRYKGIFERANALIASSGLEEFSIPAGLYASDAPQGKTTSENGYWGDGFERLVDYVRAGIENSCIMAEQMISALEQDKTCYALDACNN